MVIFYPQCKKSVKCILNPVNLHLISGFFQTPSILFPFISVYTLTDTLFVSWGVGENAMGGVSVVFPFVILQGAISTALGGGAASI